MPVKATKPIQRANFFAVVREKLFAGKLSAAQVAGIEAVLNEWERQRLSDRRWLGYMLGTVYHETGKTMQPVSEVGRGAGLAYGTKLKMGGGPNRRIPYKTPDQIYYGRGHCQLTWYENYELMGRLLKIDLLRKPSLALDMKVSVQILFEGMMKASSSFGDFTGHCLEQYFNRDVEDWVNARKIINGLDHAKTIANISKIFFTAAV